MSEMNLFLKNPIEGAKQFFASSPSRDKQLRRCRWKSIEQVWKLLEFLLWSHQDSNQYSNYFAWLGELASGGRGFEETFTKNSPQRGVCGKRDNRNVAVFRCKTCELNEISIQCTDCYENADHEGHDVVFFFADNNICGCGDPELMLPRELDVDAQKTCRLVCGYMIYLLSHAFSSDHHDVIYLPENMCNTSAFHTTFVKLKLHLHETQTYAQFPSQLFNPQKQLMVYDDDNHSIAQSFLLSFFVCLFKT
ncbi:hypothetical protein RFI_20849 [Reticulomyxa filosa]|uniref:E3 ubiquitin-protein ligase n=1 Tax=Reticulomyxa filosa TaxID=46433 RepID=X6MRQ8_RETFI|nr:hypothetical protein RFI_20849 [Reticulomyxa filosa]|eukprot:ETO16489.1 hypothetical protein RFI_20849 [Reticulomyxa filosa]